ncbi:hypothetical protein [Actinophytocola sp.]|uniref:hypothetical protein n=1 Tax=Actinophytocola sp. TaxID=1872138 RepID=UPI003899CE1C
MTGWLVPVLASMAMALPTTADDVSITMADGVSTVSSGDTLEYRVTLHNSNRAEPATVHLELSLPVGAAGRTVSPGGETLEPWLASWHPTVPPGGEVTVSATFVAGDPRPTAKGYAAQACLVTNNINQACATDINQLPGREDVHARQAPAPPSAPTWPVWLAAGAAAAAAALVVRRRRGRVS